MNRTPWIALGIAVLAAIGAYLYFQTAAPPEAPAPPPAQPAPPPPAAAAPEPHYEIPAPPPAAAPAAPAALDDSDSQMRQALEQLLGAPAAAMLTPKSLVRRIVATVDSLDRAPIPVRLRAIGAVPGALAVDGSGGALTLSPRNALRYEVLVAALRATDGARIGALYRDHYAWFQQAYEDLGYPGRYFNDRLVHVINHLLATPEVPPPVALAQSGTLYTYADPALEALSSGQKTLLRMGSDDAALVKARLREIRRAVTNKP